MNTQMIGMLLLDIALPMLAGGIREVMRLRRRADDVRGARSLLPDDWREREWIVAPTLPSPKYPPAAEYLGEGIQASLRSEYLGGGDTDPHARCEEKLK